MSEIRTAAIEAAEKTVVRAKLAQGWNASDPYAFEGAIGALVVDAVLPLLVAGTASRIADALDALADEEEGYYYDGTGPRGCAAIARRVGETS
jgi:hypothetical protein